MPRYNNPRKTWRYTNEFKVKAVQLTQFQGVQEIARGHTERRAKSAEDWR